MAYFVTHVYHHYCYLKSTVCRFTFDLLSSPHQCRTSLAAAFAHCSQCCTFLSCAIDISFHALSPFNKYFLLQFSFIRFSVVPAPTASHHTLHKHHTHTHTSHVCKKGMNSNGKPVQDYTRSHHIALNVSQSLSLSYQISQSHMWCLCRNEICLAFFFSAGFFHYTNSLASTTTQRLNFIQHKSLLSSNYSHFAYCQHWCVCQHPVVVKDWEEET